MAVDGSASGARVCKQPCTEYRAACYPGDGAIAHRAALQHVGNEPTTNRTDDGDYHLLNMTCGQYMNNEHMQTNWEQTVWSSLTDCGRE